MRRRRFIIPAGVHSPRHFSSDRTHLPFLLPTDIKSLIEPLSIFNGAAACQSCLRRSGRRQGSGQAADFAESCDSRVPAGVRDIYKDGRQSDDSRRCIVLAAINRNSSGPAPIACRPLQICESVVSVQMRQSTHFKVGGLVQIDPCHQTRETQHPGSALTESVQQTSSCRKSGCAIFCIVYPLPRTTHPQVQGERTTSLSKGFQKANMTRIVCDRSHCSLYTERRRLARKAHTARS
jgi:hypothetical protein